MRYPSFLEGHGRANAAPGTRHQMRAGRPGGVLRARFRQPRRARRWPLPAPMDRAKPRCCGSIAGLLTSVAGSIDLEGGERELTLAEQAHYLGHRDAMKPALSVLENLAFWRDFLGGEAFECRRKPGRGRARSCRASAGGVSVGRTAPAALDRPVARGATADLAAGRADLGARCRRAEPVCRPDARPSRARRPDRRRHPCAAGD